MGTGAAVGASDHDARDERARDERARDERARDERARDERARDERARDERARDERAPDPGAPPAGDLRAVVAARWEAWRHDRRLGALLCACVAVAAGFAWWRAGAGGSPPAAAPTAPVTRPTQSEPVAQTTTANAVVVNVVGAVRAPGVVRVAAGARVIDAVTAAGGATPDADLERLNLAAPVADGSRIAVPKFGEAPPALDPAAVAGAPAGGEAPAGGGAAAGPVNLNTASAAQLEELPGIGPATAKAIIDDRTRNGRFATVDDLGRVRGIGDAKLAALRDLVTV